MAEQPTNTFRIAIDGTTYSCRLPVPTVGERALDQYPGEAAALIAARYAPAVTEAILAQLPSRSAAVVAAVAPAIYHGLRDSYAAGIQQRRMSRLRIGE